MLSRARKLSLGIVSIGLIAASTSAQEPRVLDDGAQVGEDVDDPIVDPQICVQLTVDNLVGGSVATFHVAGGPPGEKTAILWSLSTGSYAGTLGPWCYDFGLTVTPPPSSQLVLLGTFDAVGVYEGTKFIPSIASGWLVYFQAAVRNTCPDTCMSNIHDEVVG